MLTFADSFNTYGTNAGFMLNGLYANASGTIVADPSDPTRNVFQTDSTNHTTQVPLPNLVTTQGMAFRIWAPSLPCNVQFGWFDDTYPDIRFFFTFSNSGRVQLWKRDNPVGDPVVIATSAFPALTANAWWHVEVKALFSLTGTGTFELRIEGIPVLVQTGLNTSIAQPYLAGMQNNHAVTTNIKDFVLWDGSGSHNNNFLGSVQVYDLLPTSDVALNWTPTGAANGYSILSDVPPNDAKYISAAWPAPSPYEAGMSDLPTNISSIKGVITRYRAAKIDGGDGQIQPKVKSGVSSQTGTDRAITVAQTFYEDIFEVDPNTTAAWTVDAVNAMTLQLNRTV